MINRQFEIVYRNLIFNFLLLEFFILKRSKKFNLLKETLKKYNFQKLETKNKKYKFFFYKNKFKFQELKKT